MYRGYIICGIFGAGGGARGWCATAPLLAVSRLVTSLRFIPSTDRPLVAPLDPFLILTHNQHQPLPSSATPIRSSTPTRADTGLPLFPSLRTPPLPLTPATMASPTTQTANAIAAIQNRANIVVPEIDFTQHQLENGEVVSTTERVVKDVSGVVIPSTCAPGLRRARNHETRSCGEMRVTVSRVCWPRTCSSR